MLIQLPPKRFDQVDDPIYDSIRNRPWFAKLEKRRVKLPLLKAAYDMMVKGWKNQRDSAETFGVDDRELRDYAAFRDGNPLVPLAQMKGLQLALDDAYASYCADNAKRHISHYISSVAPLYRWKARHICELWETDQTFLPTGY